MTKLGQKNRPLVSVLSADAAVSPLTVTRADAAKMLLTAKEVLDARGSASLLDWS